MGASQNSQLPVHGRRHYPRTGESEEPDRPTVTGELRKRCRRNDLHSQGRDRVLKIAFELALRRSKKHLTSTTKASGVLKAIETVIVQSPRTPDMGESATTMEAGNTIAATLQALSADKGNLGRTRMASGRSGSVAVAGNFPADDAADYGADSRRRDAAATPADLVADETARNSTDRLPHDPIALPFIIAAV